MMGLDNMEERKFVELKKEEYEIKSYIKQTIGKGKFSSISIEYAPVGERIIIATTKPGLLIGRGGEKIAELTEILKKRFKLENPHIEIKEIIKAELDAQTVADEIALMLERLGSIKFKIVAYQMIGKIRNAGALGVEIRLSGKLPSDRAKSWRFASGYLKKVGDTAKIVNYGEATAETLAGTIGIKVSILSPDVKIHDRIEIDENINKKIKSNLENINKQGKG